MLLSPCLSVDAAIDVFNHMSNASIECDAVTCCSLITALDKGGQWQLAEQVREEERLRL